MGAQTTALALLFLGLSGCWLTPEELRVKLGDTDANSGVDTDPGSADTDADTDTDTDADTDADSDSDADTDADTDADADTDTLTDTGGDPFACVDVNAGNGLGSVNGTTTGAGDDHQGVCHGMATDGEDVVVEWTAPHGGCFSFRTVGSNFNTVLYARATCGGEELACNDDLNNSANASEVAMKLEADDQLLLFVDARDAGTAGTFVLAMAEGTELTADQDIGSAEGVGAASGDTTGSDDTLELSCPTYETGADTILMWTAPRAGFWSFYLEPSLTNFDTVLSLHRQCSSAPLACADRDTSPNPIGGGEQVIARFFAGEVVFIRIGGWDPEGVPLPQTGTWSLDITEL